MSTQKERLRRQTGEASRATLAELDRRTGRPPAAGDLFVLPQTAEHFVEWAILDRDPEDPRRLLAVPADTHSLAGTADVAVETGGRGHLSLRCAYPAWVDAGLFDPARRTGSLEPEALERARRKQSRVARGTAGGSVLEREVDDEAEYLEWTDVLEQALAALRRAGGAPAENGGAGGGPAENGGAGGGPAADGGEASGPEESGDAESRPEDPEARQETGRVVAFPSRWNTTSSVLAVAASVLLVVSLGLGRKLATAAGEHRAVVAEQRAELDRLGQERQQLAESHARDLARLDGERQARELEHQQRIAELEASVQPRPKVNLPLLILATGQLRGPADTLEVAPGADSLLLILGIDEPQAYERYRLEVLEANSGRQVWQDSGLEPSRLSELTVLLPRALMPDGRYALRLHGLRGGRSEQLMERLLTVSEKR